MGVFIYLMRSPDCEDLICRKDIFGVPEIGGFACVDNL